MNTTEAQQTIYELTKHCDELGRDLANMNDLFSAVSIQRDGYKAALERIAEDDVPFPKFIARKALGWTRGVEA